MRNIKRAAVIAHYDCDDMVDEYVYHYLNELKNNTDLLVFVSTAKLSNKDVLRLAEYCSNVIVRPNIGYDFMSYKIGLNSFVHDEFDEILICNDSVYAPLFSLEKIFDNMVDSSVDFWGITDNYVSGHHLQSYFIVFKKQVFNAEIFKKFWEEVTVLSDKNSIIQNYEIGLSVKLTQNGFNFIAIYSYIPNKILEFWIRLKRVKIKTIIQKLFSISISKYYADNIGTLNNTHFFWEKMIEAEIPFLKIELLRDNPANIDISNIYTKIEMKSNYDTALIKNHLKRIKNDE